MVVKVVELVETQAMKFSGGLKPIKFYKNILPFYFCNIKILIFCEGRDLLKKNRFCI